jgi:RNA polymerase sigma factor (sigma-70 family)
LKEICKQHKRWINTVKQFGITDFAEDVVQEAYLKCLEKENVNEAYFYLTLRSLSMDLHRKQKQIIKVSIDEILDKYEIAQYYQNKTDDKEIINEIDNINWNNCIKILSNEITLSNEVLEVVNNFHWFDKEVFYLYYDNKISMRKIAEETKISLSTIFKTIKDCNLKIKKEWQK